MTNERLLVGLSGVARSGKDTVADILVRDHGFTKVAFADSLKRGCMEFFGLTEEQCYGNLKEVVDEFWKVTPRFILQKTGTECMRNVFDKDLWVKSVQKKISQPGRWCVSDVRFLNEIEAIKSWDGRLIKVERLEAHATGGISAHASETELRAYRGWDHVVENNGTMEDLNFTVQEVMKCCLISL